MIVSEFAAKRGTLRFVDLAGQRGVNGKGSG